MKTTVDELRPYLDAANGLLRRDGCQIVAYTDYESGELLSLELERVLMPNRTTFDVRAPYPAERVPST